MNKYTWFFSIGLGIFVIIILFLLALIEPVDPVAVKRVSLFSFFAVMWLVGVIATIPIKTPKAQEIHMPRPGDIYRTKPYTGDDPFKARKKYPWYVIDEVENGYVSYWLVSKEVEILHGMESQKIIGVDKPAENSRSIEELLDANEYVDNYIRAGKYITKVLS